MATSHTLFSGHLALSMHWTHLPPPAVSQTDSGASHWLLSLQAAHWCWALQRELSGEVHCVLSTQATHLLVARSQWVPWAQVLSSAQSTQRFALPQTWPLLQTVLSTQGTHSFRAVLHCGVAPEHWLFATHCTHRPPPSGGMLQIGLGA
ncbi:MAG: hypothetical protein ABI895_09735 [Deltaproteobacteria bacterium]